VHAHEINKEELVTHWNVTQQFLCTHMK